MVKEKVVHQKLHIFIVETYSPPPLAGNWEYRFIKLDSGRVITNVLPSGPDMILGVNKDGVILSGRIDGVVLGGRKDAVTLLLCGRADMLSSFELAATEGGGVWEGSNRCRNGNCSIG